LEAKVFQGYLFSKPVPPGEVLPLLAEIDRRAGAPEAAPRKEAGAEP
jgi:EAL domain-containing protein (putative c-di-GMP-specific phosphodiesterase class I)